MFDARHLESIYQQWIQGNEAYIHRWAEFVEMIAKMNNVSGDVVMRELQKHRWFEWTRE
jgi:hypothetical protein